MFQPESPALKYHQNLSNSSCLGHLESAFHSIGEDISLTLQTNIFKNRIYFSNDIMRKKLRHKGEQRLRYNLER